MANELVKLERRFANPSEATRRMCRILGARWVPSKYLAALRTHQDRG